MGRRRRGFVDNVLLCSCCGHVIQIVDDVVYGGLCPSCFILRVVDKEGGVV